MVKVSEARLVKYCEHHHLTREQGLNEGLNGVKEILLPLSPAMAAEYNYNVIVTGSTVAAIGLGMLMVDPEVVTPLTQDWVTTMRGIMAGKLPGEK